jgi:N-acetylmuramoyl-L-alanine amidase
MMAIMKRVPRDFTRNGMGCLCGWALSIGVVSFLSLSVSLLGGAACAYAAPRAEKKLSASGLAYEEVRQRYFKLRNTDTEVEKPAEWSKIAAELDAFIEAHPKSQEAPAALMNLSHLWEQLFLRSKQERMLLQSLAALSRLVREYPKDDRADDALLRAAELTEVRFQDTSGAARLNERVLSRYPASDSAPKARERLKLLRVGGAAQSPFLSPKTKPLGRAGAAWVVVLDPGHGGEDYGAKGAAGLLEKDVVLAVALEAERLLEQDPSIDVELTRRGDSFVPLAERTKIANEWRADLFLSVHNNASDSGEFSGLQTFYLDMAGDESSRLLAERENGAEVLLGAEGDLAFMLSDLTQSAKQAPSISLAHDVHAAVLGATSKDWGRLKDRGVLPGPFYVLVGAHMPCALVELFFVDNPQDGALLARKEFRTALAQGLARGVRKYLSRGSVRPVVRTSN